MLSGLHLPGHSVDSWVLQLKFGPGPSQSSISSLCLVFLPYSTCRHGQSCEPKLIKVYASGSRYIMTKPNRLVIVCRIRRNMICCFNLEIRWYHDIPERFTTSSSRQQWLLARNAGRILDHIHIGSTRTSSQSDNHHHLMTNICIKFLQLENIWGSTGYSSRT